MGSHSGDCTIYSALANGRPEDGICTCGFGWRRKRAGDESEMYSKELQKQLQAENNFKLRRRS